MKGEQNHVSTSYKHDIMDTWAFAEWLGENYVKLHAVWVHKRVDQRNKDNWKDTGELWAWWWENARKSHHNTGVPKSCQADVSGSLLLDDSELKRLIWEEWEGEIKNEDPRQMVLKYMKLMRNEFIKQ